MLLICTGQLALNPRLVKEADALFSAGFNVTVIYLYWNSWAKELDRKLLKRKNWTALQIGGDPDTGAFTYFITRVVHKISTVLARYIGFKYNLAELAIGRGVRALSEYAESHPADLYIAHNLAALSVAAKAAKKNNSKYGFDAEDFYRHDLTDDPASFDVRLRKFLEEKYFPFADYSTASSEDIATRYEQLFPSKESTVILNVFPANRNFLSDPAKEDKPLRLFWFSQSVGLSRGIQDVIAAMKILEGQDIEFHILGDLGERVKAGLDQFVRDLNFTQDPAIFYHKPIDPDELISFAARFDIGLATEPGFSINNDIALSNKIFTYINAGLAIVASDTTSQAKFLKKYNEIGKIYRRKDAVSLSNILNGYIQNRKSLFETQKAAYLLGKNELNWERESKKFIRVIRSALDMA